MFLSLTACGRVNSKYCIIITCDTPIEVVLFYFFFLQSLFLLLYVHLVIVDKCWAILFDKYNKSNILFSTFV